MSSKFKKVCVAVTSRSPPTLKKVSVGLEILLKAFLGYLLVVFRRRYCHYSEYWREKKGISLEKTKTALTERA